MRFGKANVLGGGGEIMPVVGTNQRSRDMTNDINMLK